MKVGDYAYIKGCRNVGIGKIIDIYDTPEGENIDIQMKTRVYKSHINRTISSPKIIDLIEVGDYINGYYVEEIRHRYDGEMVTILDVATGSNYFQAPMYNEDIKSIVTKEQFENISYKVGD